MSHRHLVFWALFTGFLISDQTLKAWVRDTIPVHGSLAGMPWPGVFELTLSYNMGIAFGLFQGLGPWMAPVAIAIAAACIVYSFRHPREAVLVHIALALLASGAIGNMIDRIWLGKVTDMFWFRPINFPVFNIADSCISVGTLLLLIAWWRDPKLAKDPLPQNKAQPETPRAESEYSG